MKRKTVHNIKEILNITALWILLTFFYVFIKFSDIPEHFIQEIYGNGTGIEISKIELYKISFLVALPFGLVMGILYTTLYPILYHRCSFKVNVAVRLAIFTSMSSLIFFIMSGFSAISPILSANALGIFIYMLLTEIIVGILILLRRDLGRNYFRNTVINTYHTPKEEQRVFMFLDMENSTPTADKIGHLNYSRYIQDCFYDLSDIVLEHEGDIYQFVGDEAVITWKVAGRFKYEKCIALYFAYMDCLNRKQKYYLDKYGLSPVFKCAIHKGTVSTALVGDYKKEIAYHGDVLNICSRLQSACKKSSAYVLISGDFYSNIVDTEKYTYKPVHLNDLKGVKHEQDAFFVFKNTD